MELGSGFSAALKEEALGGSGELAAMFGRLFEQLGEDLYRRLREDVIAEVRAEVQRAEASEMTDQLCAALEKVRQPVVNVAPAAVTVTPTVEVEAPDVTVNIPKNDPKVTVEKPKHIKIVRDADERIIGAEVS